VTPGGLYNERRHRRNKRKRCTNRSKNDNRSEGLHIVNRKVIDGKKNFIETLDNLDILESALEDTEYFQKVGTALCQIGGDNVKSITRNVLFEILSNKIAAGFSWAGVRGKKSFKDLHITKLVRVVVQSQRINTSETEIDNVIGKWLVQAPLRCKREITKINKPVNSKDNSDDKNSDL
ncbi:uncharacterized protein LOC114932816, partial [Nylanderia fulva]|uniref:uncharacterized protein LOC114932816 n=1 Tax=Nylanderia fulva TaxID=613905 RepID=UPI0010FB7960